MSLRKRKDLRSYLCYEVVIGACWGFEAILSVVFICIGGEEEDVRDCCEWFWFSMRLELFCRFFGFRNFLCVVNILDKFLCFVFEKIRIFSVICFFFC